MSARLSILIPTYDYPEGLERILAGFRGDVPAELEILISDDSDGDQVGRLVEAFSRHFPGSLHYRRNRPALGAVGNWNALLEQATGEYLLLLHHDEYPLGDGFASRAIDLLERCSEDVDAVVMGCILVSDNGSVLRPHLPDAIRWLIIDRLPAYLFKRNVLGPASCLIARRSLYPRFDDRLRWLVDVDAYYRLRQTTSRWRICSGLKIASRQGRKDSITASLRQELREIDARERDYLSSKHPQADRWLIPGEHRFLAVAESIVWAGMRALTNGFYRLAYALQASPGQHRNATGSGQ